MLVQFAFFFSMVVVSLDLMDGDGCGIDMLTSVTSNERVRDDVRQADLKRSHIYSEILDPNNACTLVHLASWRALKQIAKQDCRSGSLLQPRAH